MTLAYVEKFIYWRDNAVRGQRLELDRHYYVIDPETWTENGLEYYILGARKTRANPHPATVKFPVSDFKLYNVPNFIILERK